MAEISESELKAVLAAEKADALAAVQSSKLSKERSDAMDYYNGDVSTDIPNEAGKSTAVSTDVADTIEGLMPSLMEIFCGGDEVVKFAAVSAEDVAVAEQETDYVNHVFMQKNPGFLVLYSFIKDALLSKNGIVKVWTEEEDREEKETYFNQPEDALAVLLQQPDIQVTEHTEHDGLHDITIVCKKNYKRHKVEPVPPEEFGIARRAKSIKAASYCFHETTTTVGDLIDQGYDESQVKKIPSEDGVQNTETSARDTVDESTGAGDEGLNQTTRPVKVTEHYLRMDYKRDGKPALYRIKTGGEGGDILTRKGKPDIEEVDCAPFAAMTPVIVTHRFFGKSVADLVMDIQRIKTALLRGMLNNLYLHNNPRVEVAQSHVTDQTLDDLLVSRPGGIVRTKQPGGLQWQVVPDISPSIYPALEYWDATREWRTGVTRQGQGIDAKALADQSATAANQLFTMAQARMRLIARIFAETGIRDLFWLLHYNIRKYGDQAQTVELRNKWVTVNPREFKQRDDMTVTVGLGDGSKAEKLMETQILIGAQEKGVAAGIVSKRNLYNSAKRLTRLMGEKDPEAYFVDPGQPPNPQDPTTAPIEPPTDPKLTEIQLKAQLEQASLQQKSDIERLQAQADIATQDRKTQAEIALAERKFQLERELKLMDAQIKREQAGIDLQMKAVDHENKQQERQAKAEEAAKPKASIEVKHGADEITGPLSEVVEKLGKHMADQSNAQMGALMATIEAGRKPSKRRVKAPSGKVYEIEDAQ